MLNVDVDHLVVKFESGLSLLNEIKKDMPVASKQEQNLEFQRRVVGSIIVQKYDSKLYRVKGIDFS